MTTMITDKVGSFDIRMWKGGSGAPLLYLHGFEQHPGQAPFLERLAERHAVRAPEHPGYGESTGIEALHDIFDIALHYRRVIEDWNVGPVDVIGHSLGGMFAAELAAISPHLVRRLVLVAPYGLWLDEAPLPDPFVLTPDELRRAKWNDPAAAAEREPSVFAGGGPGAAALFRAKNLGSATKFMWPIPDRGLRRRLSFVRAPTLIVQGEADGLVLPAYADAFAALIPGARAERMAGVGHLPMVEAEDAFITVVERFLG